MLYETQRGQKMNKKAGMFTGIFVIIMAIGMLGVGMTYTNGKSIIEDKTSMAMISHTEYKSGETGQIVARIVDFQGNPIVSSCYATIIMPNKTAFVTNQSMSVSNIAGNYYKTFTTPSAEGVYEYQATCYYGLNKKQHATNSFHLSPALNQIGTVLTQVGQMNVTLANFVISSGSNFTKIYNAIQSMNSTMVSQFSSLNATMISQFTGLNNSMAVQLTNLNSSIATQLFNLNSSIASQISAITVNTNTTALENLIIATNTSIQNKLDIVNLNILSVNNTMVAKFNLVDARFNSVDGNLSKILARQVQINNTVTNTYDLLSIGVVNTLSSMDGKLNSLLGITGQINATVTNIKTDTGDILMNQQNQVYMNVVSG